MIGEAGIEYVCVGKWGSKRGISTFCVRVCYKIIGIVLMEIDVGERWIKFSIF